MEVTNGLSSETRNRLDHPHDNRAEMDASGEPIIDESLHSRAIYALGKEAMQQIAKSQVLICGLDGLGLEVAKNLVLGGVKRATLYDPRPATDFHLASHFYLREEDSSTNGGSQSLARLSQPRLAELNHYVKVDLLEGHVDAGDTSVLTLPPVDQLAEYRVIVLCNQGCSRTELLHWADAVHEAGRKLILLNTRGIFAQLFVDFGKQFTVIDPNGEEPLTVMIQAIESAEEAVVTCLEETRHGFQTGDFVTFTEVSGMTELNDCKPRRVTVQGPFAFSIGDTTKLSKYVSGGLCTQVKMPKDMEFKSLRESLRSPEFLINDFVKMSRPVQLHVLFQLLDNIRQVPRPWNREDAQQFVEMGQAFVKTLADQLEPGLELDRKLAALFSFTAAGNLMPMQAILGGLAAQEVMKACSQRLTPISQWFYFDCEEILPQPLFKAPVEGAASGHELELSSSAPLPEDCQVEKTPELRRYAGQVAVLGKNFQQRLASLRYFVVGAGAIGCELLKNFAMMGLGSSPQGSITVTDMDLIEKSNLSRQFLFRNKDIGQFKSTTAARAIKQMNPQVNVTALELRVGAETENFFTDAFFERLDGVANALDNVDARTYIDRRCVFYRKPLLESGTLGTKGNVQVIVPHITESYSSSRDPPEKGIPLCTLKNFPYAIEHSLQWARDAFQGYFFTSAEVAAAYLENPQLTINKTMELPGNEPMDTLNELKQTMCQRPRNYMDCVQWARELFETQFTNQIKQLLYNFPADQQTESGTPFWSGTKRCPHPLQFDAFNPTHLEFVYSAANLRAAMYGLSPCLDRAQVQQWALGCRVPTFTPQGGLKIEVNEAEMAAAANRPGKTDANVLQHLLAEIAATPDLANFRVNPIEFEKDDDENFHMDFITAASNLRAENYDIAPADRSRSKLIAGRIIPAIATTTSIVAGLVALELYKLVQGHAEASLFKNCFLNLALPFMIFSEPTPPPKLKYYDRAFTLWDRFELRGEMTLGEFINYFEREHKLSISIISQGYCMLYSFFLNENTRKQRLEMSLRQVVETVSKKPIPPYMKTLVLELCCSDEADEDLEVPFVTYVLPE